MCKKLNLKIFKFNKRKSFNKAVDPGMKIEELINVGLRLFRSTLRNVKLL